MSRIEDTIEVLIKHADPDGNNHRKLLHIKGMMSRNVMIGPGLRSFVADLMEQLDKIECRHIRYDGVCVRIRDKGQCDHLQVHHFAEVRCNSYEAARPQTKGDAVQLGGFYEK